MTWFQCLALLLANGSQRILNVKSKWQLTSPKRKDEFLLLQLSYLQLYYHVLDTRCHFSRAKDIVEAVWGNYLCAAGSSRSSAMLPYWYSSGTETSCCAQHACEQCGKRLLWQQCGTTTSSARYNDHTQKKAQTTWGCGAVVSTVYALPKRIYPTN